jgi:hypothetical protein
MNADTFAYIAVGAAGAVHALEHIVSWLTGLIKAIQTVDPSAK